jgi:hypothetical protein
MRLLTLATALFFGVGAAGTAQPYLVDTGAGTAPSGLILDGDPGVLVWTQSWHAGLFTLDHDTLISGVEAWMSVGSSGAMTTIIYAANAGLPRASPALFSATYELDQSGSHIAWRGVSGLNWRLSAGTYWLDEEPQHESTFSGALWRIPPSPLAHYAESVRGDTWEFDPAGRDGLDQWRLRITGMAVPESTI